MTTTRNCNINTLCYRAAPKHPPLFLFLFFFLRGDFIFVVRALVHHQLVPKQGPVQTD